MRYTNRFFAKSIEIRYLSQNITLMETSRANQNLESWVEQKLSLGRYSFSLNSLRESFYQHSETAIKFALKRLTDKGKILSVYKGYYLILPPQYSGKGILPPALFVDAFMKFLGRPYYVSLLNAAAYHGAAHQQPQEYFVITTFPVMRATQKKGLKLNYVCVKSIPDKLLEKRKTESGYLNVSNPALTATDLVQFEKRIGGLSRAATILNELADVLKPMHFDFRLMNHAPVTVLQRLGYVLELICFQTELADALYNVMRNKSIKFYRVPLNSSAPIKGYFAKNRWRVIVNAKIEIDE